MEKQSIKPPEKLRLESEFLFVRENGVKNVGRYCLVVIAPSPDGILRYGVICGKRYSNKAVHRNRARRLLWESLRLLKRRISEPKHMVLIVRKRISDAKQPDVQKDIEKILTKSGLMKS